MNLSAVGRMKFNRRVGREELTVQHDVQRRHRRGDPHPGRSAQRPRRDDDIDHSATGACARWGVGGEPVPRRAGAGRAGVRSACPRPSRRT